MSCDKPIWKRLESESSQEFEAFQTYLQTPDRSFTKVAEKLKKTVALISRWAKKYDWNNRAVAWDNKVLEDVRKEISRRKAKTYLRQWHDLEDLQIKAKAAMTEEKFARASPKTLNEIYQTSRQGQLELIDKLDTTNKDDSSLTVVIEGKKQNES